MKEVETSEEALLKPIIHTGKAFYFFLAVLMAIIVWFGYAWYTQLTSGLTVTGMGDIPGGSPWGVYIANFVWYVGIAQGGIALAAAIRLMKLEQLKPVARMASVLAVITMLIAGMNIVFDLGRPDRISNMILYYWERIGHSPLLWDMTVIIGYWVLSVTYLVITMREDLAALKDKLPSKWNPLYKLVLVGYNPKEKAKVEQISWWLALSLIVLIALLSGGVTAWIFGLMPARPGWFGAVQGPVFLTAALTSAIASVIIIAAILRRIFGWQNHIRPEVFKSLSKVLAVFTLVYLWFILNEQLAAQFAGPLSERIISEALFIGRFSYLFLPTVAGLILSFIFLAIQALRSSGFSLKGTVLASLVILIALWIKRYLFLVTSLLYPRLPYPTGSYTPTWTEWSLIAGTFAITFLAYLLFVKVYPIMELKGR
jgi:molybdopterin-containing oxidoreductase family membrane subunit